MKNKKTIKYFILALTPREYLEKYCRVHHRRCVLYKRVFDKHRDIEAELNMEVRNKNLFNDIMKFIEFFRCFIGSIYGYYG